MRKRYKEDGRGEPRMVRQLMSFKKTTPVVLGFIDTTRAGQRVQSQEQERRRQKRERNEAWSLEVNRMEGDEEEEAENETEIRERGGEACGE